MSAEEIGLYFDELKEKCDDTLAAYKKELQKVRTGRASSSLLDSIYVDYYGSRTQLIHLGQVNTPEPRLVTVTVFDGSAVDSVEKAIRNSDLGLNPSRDGNVIRLSIPPLTEQSRKDLVKLLHKQAEEIRVSIRNHRRDTNDSLKKLEKAGGVTQDEIKKALEQVQKATDSYISNIEVMLKDKEEECMTV